MLAVLLAIVHSEVQVEFVATEWAPFYSFFCNDTLRMSYRPLDGVGLIIRTSHFDLTCTAYPSNTQIPLSFDNHDGYAVTPGPIDLPSGPQELVFGCATWSTDDCGLSPIAQQSVASRPVILVMGIIALGFVAIDIGIIGFQFCTFHHKKHD
jgi:hypothetical protein